MGTNVMKKGEKMTAESREKMRISALKRFSDKRNHPKFGKKLSSQSLKNLSESHIGQKVSDETRKKLSDARKGDKHWNWKPDRTSLAVNEKKHLDSKYREWSRSVKNRDCWKCRISDDTCSGRLEAHHILNWAEYPELRYKISNGITLCHSHHPRGREKEKRLSPYFMELVSVSK
jgi:hypothetical protein